MNLNDMEFREISSKEATDFILPRHYSGRKAPVSVAFGWFCKGSLMATCTFGKPASNSLCKGICGVQWSPNVYELNRLCREEDLDVPLSAFVSRCLRALKPRNWIVVSYSDTGMHHNGYIYQACSFLYTGTTKQRTDKWTPGNKHSRHYRNDEQHGIRKVRTPKNRYVYFCTSDRKIKREWAKCLAYPILPYPKAKNENYVLGEFQKPLLVGKEEIK